MKIFDYRAANSVADAIAAAGPGSAFLAAGTEVVPALRDGLLHPDRLIDLLPLGLDGIERRDDGLRLGGLARLSDIASHPEVLASAPALASAIEQSGTAAIRSMGTLAGNLLQQVRCPYYRGAAPCNRRAPGSGCSVARGDQRHAALMPLSFHCAAVHPSDPAVALASLDATIVVEGRAGRRTLSLDQLYPAAGAVLGVPSVLESGDLIIALDLPAGRLPGRYAKIRDRSSFDFALVSAAGGLRLEGGVVVEAALALGGIAWKPWRCRRAEAMLVGRPWSADLVRQAVAAELSGATPLEGTRFKVELAIRAAATVLDPGGPS